MLDQAMSLINNPATGGVAGLVEAFEKKGFGDVMNSWISTRENKPMSPDQIKQALGSENIQRIAEKVGMSKDAVFAKSVTVVPQLIDKLMPNGKLPEAGKLSDALNMLKNSY